MVFSSHIFLFYFLPFALALYFIVGKKWRNAILTQSEIECIPAKKHKELQNEYTVEGLSVFDLPMYYSSEINTHH